MNLRCCKIEPLDWAQDRLRRKCIENQQQLFLDSARNDRAGSFSKASFLFKRQSCNSFFTRSYCRAIIQES